MQALLFSIAIFTSSAWTAPGGPSPNHLLPTKTLSHLNGVPPPGQRQSGIAACERISISSEAHVKTAGPASTPTVPADLAYECINSIPFVQDLSIQLMDSIRPYLDWQSTLQYVKDPPPEYADKVQAPYDFHAEFERIYDKVRSSSYVSDYAFGFELYMAFQQVFDGHFGFLPQTLGLIFEFGRTIPLVSVSLKEMSIPQVYAYQDIVAASSGNATFVPSPLAHIDGKNSTEWLLNLAQYGNVQDKDALWNIVFHSHAQMSQGPTGYFTGSFAGGGMGRLIYSGPKTTLEFQNGTVRTLQNFARVLPGFNALKNVPGLAAQTSMPAFSSVSLPACPIVSTATPTTIKLDAPAGYPSPIFRDDENENSGYFLEGEGYDDIAVLALPKFGDAHHLSKDFQRVDTYVLNQAVAQGKRKLIIDLSANGGGVALLAYDLFKQLFPHQLPYGASRFRAHEAIDLIGKEVSWGSGRVPRSLNDDTLKKMMVSSSFNYRTDVNDNYQNFDSWHEKYGPYALGPHSDNYTSILRWNLSDPMTFFSSDGIDVSGYLNRSYITKQPFAAEDIVLVYDGYCASTCALFSELMTAQGGVKTIALGGRPNKDIMQAVGGTKGSQVMQYWQIRCFASMPGELQRYHSAAYYNTTVLGQYTNDFALMVAPHASVNVRNAYAENDRTQTPLQFVYQPADCRMYYTPEMVVSQEAVWKRVADTAFRGIDHCVAGGLS